MNHSGKVRFAISLGLSILCLSFINPEVKVVVQPQGKKQSAGIYIRKDDRIKIRVAGKWSLWDKYDPVDGEGHNFTVNGFNWGALMGQIGDNAPFLIGNALDFKSQSDGVLYLFPNKGDYRIENPSGSLVVTVDGGIDIDKFKKEIADKSKKFLYDPKQGRLMTNLVVKAGDTLEIYAFGQWTMWQDVYPETTADGHDFKAGGVNWGKLYGGIGSTSGDLIEKFPVGEKTVYKVNSGEGLLTLYPYLNGYESNPGGFLEIYIIGGSEATESDKSSIDEAIRQDIEKNIVAKINAVRAACGLDALLINPAFSKTSFDHAKYMAVNNSFDRDENDSKPFFTGATLQDRLKLQKFEGESRELFCQTDSPEKALDMLVDSVYHRLRLLDPRIKYTGFSDYRASNDFIYVLDLGYMDEKEQEKDWETIVYPANEQTGVKVMWDGNESPSPVPIGTAGPFGYPVSILFKKQVTKVIKNDLLDNSNKPVDCFVITPFNDLNNKQINGIILIPKKPLDYNTKYTVDVRAAFGGDQKEFTWTFVTKAQADNN